MMKNNIDWWEQAHAEAQDDAIFLYEVGLAKLEALEEKRKREMEIVEIEIMEELYVLEDRILLDVNMKEIIA